MEPVRGPVMNSRDEQRSINDQARAHVEPTIFSALCYPESDDSVDNCQSLRRYRALEICSEQFGERARVRLTRTMSSFIHRPVSIVAAPTIQFCSILTNESRPITRDFSSTSEYRACTRISGTIRICLFNWSIMVLF